MAGELVDLRLKITLETACALAAHARAHDIEKPEVAREILAAWAEKQIHGARMLASCLHAKGLTSAAEGIAGAAQGTAAQSGAGLSWDDA